MQVGHRALTSVSVVIPNLHSPVLGAVLDGLAAQAGLAPDLELEVIVVGLDGPGTMAGRRDARLVDTGQPMPPAAARNLGASQAAGEVIVFLDADCVPDPSWLTSLLAALGADSSPRVVGGAMRLVADGYWQLADNISTFYPALASSPERDCALLASFSLAVPRPVWDRVGPFDERYARAAAEDSDWSLRAGRAGVVLHFTPQAVVLHRHSRGSLADLWRHAVQFGANSTKVDPRWFPRAERPWPLRHWLACLVAAPAMALVVTWKAFANDRALWRHAHTAPAVYLAKLGWCWGAAKTLRAEAIHPPSSRPAGG